MSASMIGILTGGGDGPGREAIKRAVVLRRSQAHVLLLGKGAAPQGERPPRRVGEPATPGSLVLRERLGERVALRGTRVLQPPDLEQFAAGEASFG